MTVLEPAARRDLRCLPSLKLIRQRTKSAVAESLKLNPGMVEFQFRGDGRHAGQRRSQNSGATKNRSRHHDRYSTEFCRESRSLSSPKRGFRPTFCEITVDPKSAAGSAKEKQNRDEDERCVFAVW